MAWEVAVSGVVDVLSGVEHGWEVEFVKLLRSEADVVLDTIAIFVVDLVGIKCPVSLNASLKKIELLHLFSSSQELSPVAQVLLSLEELFLGSLQALLDLGLFISLLLGISGISLSEGVGAWLWVLSPSNMSGKLTIPSVVKILDSRREDHLPELIKGLLIMLDVVLDTIAIGIDDSSWLVGWNGHSGCEHVSVLGWHVCSVKVVKFLGGGCANQGCKHKRLFIHFYNN
jgi:hypothetical protein